ncbi:MAG: response regulator [Myxococcota bacterium]|nr:response regulator [Myxococcota bacterium]
MPSIRVLIVDDEQEYATALAERLTMRNLDVATADSGESALAALEKRPVDVVVLDVMMPGMGGLDVLVEIKKHYPKVSVLLLSGHAEMQTAIKGMELGAYDYLVKPVNIDELIYKIEDAHQAV